MISRLGLPPLLSPSAAHIEPGKGRDQILDTAWRNRIACGDGFDTVAA